MTQATHSIWQKQNDDGQEHDQSEPQGVGDPERDHPFEDRGSGYVTDHTLEGEDAEARGRRNQ